MIKRLRFALIILGGIASLLFGLALSVAADQERTVHHKGLDRQEFRLKFRNNPDLSKADLDDLPAAARAYLQVGRDWRELDTVAFSHEISRARYLVVLKHMETENLGSRAILVSCCRKAEWSREIVTWRPLYLLIPTDRQDGWPTIVSDYHPNLEWNDELDAVQSTYCSDIANYACIRHTSKIKRSEQMLFRIELDASRRGTAWKSIWELGQWPVDPGLFDLTVR